MRKTVPLLLVTVVFYFIASYRQSGVEIPSRFLEASAIPASLATGGERSMLTRTNFEDHVRSLYDEIDLKSYQLSYPVFRMGLTGYYNLRSEGALNNHDLLTIIDFEQPSTAKRFYTIDLRAKQVKFHTYVAHGRNTGQNLATDFSNTPHSNQSSLGFYITGETYVGSKGYSLRLDGQEKSFNDKIRSRAVVIHAAKYATEDWIKRYGRLGRSQGCPALPPHLSREVINTIKDKTVIFTYYPDETYLNASHYLKQEVLFKQLDEQPIALAGTLPQS